MLFEGVVTHSYVGLSSVSHQVPIEVSNLNLLV